MSARTKQIVWVVASLVVSLGGLLAVIVTGSHPALGLDLQGGISITQEPVDSNFSSASLDVAVERIRARVDSLGVAEPEILRQGNAIVVNLPGVKNQQQAEELVKVTGQVYLRPVFACAAGEPTPAPTPETAPETVPETVPDTTVSSTSPEATNPPSAGWRSTPPAEGSATSEPTTGGASPAVTDPPGETGADAPTADAPTSDTPTTDAPTDDGTADDGLVSGWPPSDPTTTEIRPLRDGGVCQVGPMGGTGEVFQDDATARVQSGLGWTVDVSLRSGANGEGVWNALAAQCFNRQPTCPSGQLAIELDGEIISAPTVNTPDFRGSVQITGSFKESEARSLANVLRSGSLPVRLQVQAVQNVSPTLGKDSLNAAVVSGLVGVGLVLLFMIAYYRHLGLLAFAGLAVSAALLWVVISFLSKTQGLALSLAGVAGVIVSVGVTVDSYVVIFERLKDEVRVGRTFRNTVKRGFDEAWRTIVIADLVSLIGAGALWYLTVGAVRNFAFFLGLSTLIDLLVCWTFVRPVLLLVGRTKWMARRKIMGISPGEGVAP